MAIINLKPLITKINGSLAGINFYPQRKKNCARKKLTANYSNTTAQQQEQKYFNIVKNIWKLQPTEIQTQWKQRATGQNLTKYNLFQKQNLQKKMQGKLSNLHNKKILVSRFISATAEKQDTRKQQFTITSPALREKITYKFMQYRAERSTIAIIQYISKLICLIINLLYLPGYLLEQLMIFTATTPGTITQHRRTGATRRKRRNMTRRKII